ncbi:ER membrane complex subunit 2 [Balamuthia mandrillaris]
MEKAKKTSRANTTEQEFRRLLQQAPKDWHSARQLLRFLRLNKLRRSDVVLQFGPNLLAKHASALGDEVWTVREQVFEASLDVGALNEAEELLRQLQKQFPNSRRVERLKGMMKEAEGDLGAAREIFDAIIEEEPTDAITMKRRICLHKASKETRDQAIKELNDYLKVFMADTDAWQELGDLYLDQQQYEYAAFCYEELILADPFNYHFHNRYAEILFTLGDHVTARKYFAQSLELNNENNARAMFGLCICSKAIDSKKGGGAKADKDSNGQLFQHGRNALLAKYTEKAQNSSLELEVVTAALNKMAP